MYHLLLSCKKNENLCNSAFLNNLFRFFLVLFWLLVLFKLYFNSPQGTWSAAINLKRVAGSGQCSVRGIKPAKLVSPFLREKNLRRTTLAASASHSGCCINVLFLTTSIGLLASTLCILVEGLMLVVNTPTHIVYIY